MKKIHRNMMIIAGCLIVSGAVLAAAGISMGAGRGTETSYITETTDMKNLSINSLYDKILIESYDGNEISIDYPDDRICEVSEENGSFELIVSQNEFDLKKWYESIDISFGAEETAISVKVPKKFSGTINVESGSGDVTAKNVEAEKLSVKSRNGDIRMEETACSLTLEAETGDIDISGTGDQLDAESGHGRINVVSSEYRVASIGAKNGNIAAESLSCYSLYMKNKNGDIDCIGVKSESIDIISESGDVKTEEIETTMMRAESKYGDISVRLNGNSSEYSVNGSSDTKKRVYVNSEYGDTKVDFSESNSYF